jgi:hypothetical protein
MGPILLDRGQSFTEAIHSIEQSVSGGLYAYPFLQHTRTALWVLLQFFCPWFCPRKMIYSVSLLGLLERFFRQFKHTSEEYLLLAHPFNNFWDDSCLAHIPQKG